MTDSRSQLALIQAPPSGRRRRWMRWAIAGFLLSQAIIPAIYYLRGEPTTERFAWRMFSSVHMTNWRCQVVETIEVDGQSVQRDVPLDAVLEESMVAHLHAGQLDVVEQFLRRWLTRPGVERVEYVAQGVLPDGERTEPIRLVAVRDTGEIRRER